MPNLGEILKSALSLKLDDRAALAEKLLASLDELDEEEADRLWAEEAQRRLKDYRESRSTERRSCLRRQICPCLASNGGLIRTQGRPNPAACEETTIT